MLHDGAEIRWGKKESQVAKDKYSSIGCVGDVETFTARTNFDLLTYSRKDASSKLVGEKQGMKRCDLQFCKIGFNSYLDDFAIF
jgi:hypothetical protein